MMETIPTSAIMALWDTAIERKTCVGQALKVILSAGGPAALESSSRWLVGEVEAGNVLAIHAALEVDERVDVEG